jgi:heme A synthase
MRRWSPRFVVFAGVAVLAVVVQVLLGVAVVLTGTSLAVVTAHHATAAVLLGSLVLARQPLISPPP